MFSLIFAFLMGCSGSESDTADSAA